MKNIITLSVLLFLGISAISQNNIYLKINHKLGATPFAFNATNVNDLGDTFNVSRIQYYLTPYSITHDGGTVTLLNKTLLIDGGIPTYDSLGNFAITTIEKITFAIGVDSLLNHLDPSLASGDLAPQSPSMHWGWAPGYRFIVMEGKAGNTAPPTQTYELHALGDHHYHYITITTAGTTDVNGKVIELNANYVEALQGINVASGLLEHGETRNTARILYNFKNHVFTSIEGNPTVGVPELDRKRLKLTVSPNPITEGNNITIEVSEIIENAKIVITSITGQKVKELVLESNQTQIGELSSGTYIVSIVSNNNVLAFGKLIVTSN